MRIFVIAVLLSLLTSSLNAAAEKLSAIIWYGVMDVGVREFR